MEFKKYNFYIGTKVKVSDPDIITDWDPDPRKLKC